MGRRIRPILALDLDGRPIICRHAVLLSQGEIPTADWAVALITVDADSMPLIGGEKDADVLCFDGSRLGGRVRLDAKGRLHEYSRLIGISPLESHEPEWLAA